MLGPAGQSYELQIVPPSGGETGGDWPVITDIVRHRAREGERERGAS